jgi:hypothetical protein
MADQFRQAKELLMQFPNASPPVLQMKKEVRENFKRSIDFILSEAEQEQMPDERFPVIDTEKDMITLIAMWCLHWQQLTKCRLYDRRGLDYAIGQLNAEL